MTVEVTMPQMGADMVEGTLVRWLKQVGEEVKRGDVLAEIETDKATVELEAFESGVLRRQVVGEGETVPVGELIALLGDASEAIPDERPRMQPAATPVRRKVDDKAPAPTREHELLDAEIAPGTHQPPPPTEDGRLRVSPVARRIASDAGIDVQTIRGTGPDGRILRRDVEGALRAGAAPAARPSEAAAGAPAKAAPAPPATPPATGTQPLSRMRQAIARRMSQSKQSAPHYYLTLDVDMTAALAFREEFNGAAGDAHRASVNDLVIKACALALGRHPKFNAQYAEDGLHYSDRVNVDIGIAMDEGLIAPAVLDCQAKSLGQIAAEAKDLIDRAKNGHLTAEEYSAGTFTITNLGAYGVETLIGIINPPQAAILGVGSVMPQAVVRDGAVVVRQVMKVALSADHRVSDGAEGAPFIKEIQGFLERPASLAL